MYVVRIMGLITITKQRTISKTKNFLQLSIVSRKILEDVKCPVMIVEPQ